MKIKLILILIIICAQSLRTTAQHVEISHKFVLKGRYTGHSPKSIRLSYTDLGGKYIRDTCHLKNGVFTFSGNINGPTWANLEGDTKSSSSDDSNFVMIFLEPREMQCSLIQNRFKDIKLKGSSTESDYQALNQMKRVFVDEEDSLSNELTKIRASNDSSLGAPNKLISTQNQYWTSRNNIQKTDFKFIAEHPNSFLSPYLMLDYFRGGALSSDSAELLFNNLSEAVKNSPYGELIKKHHWCPINLIFRSLKVLIDTGFSQIFDRDDLK